MTNKSAWLLMATVLGVVLAAALGAYLWIYQRHRYVTAASPPACGYEHTYRVNRLSGEVEHIAGGKYLLVGVCPYSATLDCYKDAFGRQISPAETKTTKVCD